MILGRYLGGCACDGVSLKTAFCMNELIKRQTQTVFCLVFVNACKITASRATIQMSPGNTQSGKQLKYLSLSTLPLCLLSFSLYFKASL